MATLGKGKPMSASHVMYLGIVTILFMAIGESVQRPKWLTDCDNSSADR
jgi:hypothetical protein